MSALDSFGLVTLRTSELFPSQDPPSWWGVSLLPSPKNPPPTSAFSLDFRRFGLDPNKHSWARFCSVVIGCTVSFKINHWCRSVVKSGGQVSQVKPSNCFRLHHTSMISKHSTILFHDSLEAPRKISFTFHF